VVSPPEKPASDWPFEREVDASAVAEPEPIAIKAAVQVHDPGRSRSMIACRTEGKPSFAAHSELVSCVRVFFSIHA